MDFWSSIFLISFAQGLFIIFLLFRKGKINVPVYFLASLLFLMVLTNLDFYIVSSGKFRHYPHFFGISMGLMLLFGPLLYFYTQSLINSKFKLRIDYALHFIPYVLNLLANSSFYFTDPGTKISFIEHYSEYGLALRLQDKLLISLQISHLGCYLFFTLQLMNESGKRFGNIPYIISITSRLKWIKILMVSVTVFFSVVLILFIYVLIAQTLYPGVNYTYSLITSMTIYYIGYKTILTPELANPDFQKKYNSTEILDKEITENYTRQLEDMMNIQKIFLDNDLKLETLAKKMSLSSNKLSRLINEKYEKTYPDYINEYRIKEFISRVQNSEFRNFNIYGLAMEVGFNSKSTFNAAFKKATGKTPTEFKKTNGLSEKIV